MGRFLRLSPFYPLVEVYVGRPSGTVDVPDLPVGAHGTATPFPVLNLQTLDLGQTRRGRVLCKNVGSGGLRIFGPEFSGDFRTEATLDSPILGTRGRPKNLEAVVFGSPAQPEGSTWLELRFTPTDMGRHAGTLALHTNAPDLGAFFVTLQADVQGFDVELLAAEPPEDALRFGNVPVGSTAVRAVTVRNRGTIDAFVSDLVVEGDPEPGGFTVPAVVPERLVPAGGSRDFSVMFTPAAVNPEQARLVALVESTPAPSKYSRNLTIGLDGVGSGPRIVVTPETLTFSSQPIRTASAPQAVTVTNTGSAPLHITNIMSSFDWTLESQTPTPDISPGTSVEVGIVFRPGSPGPLTGTVIFDSDAPSGPAHVRLEGDGVAAPIAAIVPAVLSFGAQAIGTHALAKSVTVMSDGAADLQVSDVSLAGPEGSDFLITADTCSGATLGPEDTCRVDVLFTPVAAGARNAELQIADNAAGSPRTVALTGTGETPPPRTMSPTVLHFTDQGVGSRSQAQRVSLTNNGQDLLTVTRVETGGTAAGEFSVAQTTCLDGALTPGASCTIDVSFEPASVGTRAATLVVTDDTPGPPSALPLTGVGLGSDVTFEPTTLTFEPQPVDTFSQRQDAVLRNTGNSALRIAALTLTGDFRFDHLCGAVLGPGGFCRIRVIFVPTAAGLRSGEVRVTDDLGNIHALSLEGFGTAPEATLSSDSITFGDQAVGSTSDPQSIRLTNAGTGVLIVTHAELELGTLSDFVTDAAALDGAVLRHAEYRTIGVSFAPGSLGPHSDTLRLVTNAGDSPTNIRLSGVGV